MDYTQVPGKGCNAQGFDVVPGRVLKGAELVESEDCPGGRNLNMQWTLHFARTETPGGRTR